MSLEMYVEARRCLETKSANYTDKATSDKKLVDFVNSFILEDLCKDLLQSFDNVEAVSYTDDEREYLYEGGGSKMPDFIIRNIDEDSYKVDCKFVSENFTDMTRYIMTGIENFNTNSPKQIHPHGANYLIYYSQAEDALYNVKLN